MVEEIPSVTVAQEMLQSNPVPNVHEFNFKEDTLGYYIQKDEYKKAYGICKVKGFNLNQTLQKRSLLGVAASCGSYNCFRLFRKLGMKVSPKIAEYAIEGGNEEILKLIKKDGYDFGNLLNEAIRVRRSSTIDWILDNFKHPEMSIHYCAEVGNSECILYLLSRKVNVNSLLNGSTPLHLAAENGHYDAVTLLVDNKADVNIKDSDGSSPLYLAYLRKHEDILNFLKKRGAHELFLYRELKVPEKNHEQVVRGPEQPPQAKND